jgi:hypothetical protein
MSITCINSSRINANLTPRPFKCCCATFRLHIVVTKNVHAPLLTKVAERQVREKARENVMHPSSPQEATLVNNPPDAKVSFDRRILVDNKTNLSKINTQTTNKNVRMQVKN